MTRTHSILAAALAAVLAVVGLGAIMPASAATGPAIIGVWDGKALGAPYEPHLFTFHADGTMATTNPTNVQELGSDPTNDSLGMGVWRSDGAWFYGSFRQLNADAVTHLATDTLEVTFRAKVAGDKLTGDWWIPAYGQSARGRLEFVRYTLNRWHPAPVTPSPTPTATPPSSTTPPATTPPATTTTPPSTTTPTPSPTVTGPPGRVKPDATNTGVPAGTMLTPWTASCRITTPNTVVLARLVNCNPLSIGATGVVILNSRIVGSVNADENSATPVGFTITRSRVETPTGYTGVGATNFTADGVEIVGGNRSGYCFANCTFIRSWAHGQYVPPTSDQHASGLRFDHYTNIIDSRISCDALDNPALGGCSASITGYPDWGPVHHVTVRGNWIEPTVGYFCAYGGDTAGKPGSNHPDNATSVVFEGNEFSRGPSGVCGGGGNGAGPITDWNPDNAGNVWTANVFDDGAVIPNVCSSRACE